MKTDMTSSEINKYVSLVYSYAEKNQFKNTVYYSNGDKTSDIIKIKVTPVKISGSVMFCFEYFLTENRVRQNNVSFDNFMEELFGAFSLGFLKSDTSLVSGNISLYISKKGKITLINHISNSHCNEMVEIKENNKCKKYLLSGSEDFLRFIGISDSAGRVKDKSQAKFRQINRFCEYVTDAYKKAFGNDKKDIYICDLCCGKSYLSFALYYILSEKMSLNIKMDCVDLKQSVIDYCSDIAAKCRFDGMKFKCQDINLFEPCKNPDFVVSLHACDTATDIVLDFAIKNNAKVILSTPCCQHELFENIDCPELDFILDSPSLKQKFCAVATDSLRLLKLKANSYDADATEFTDPENTPKNILLRGFLKSKKSDIKYYSEKYESVYRFLYGDK